MLQGLEAHIQAVALVVLFITAIIAIWQGREATKQAKASEEQAKASVKMAELSLEQTELMRKQVHLSLRPIVTVTSGVYGPNSATLTLKNVGTGPALETFGEYRCGYRQPVGSLSAGQTFIFHFDYQNNLVLPPVGPIEPGNQPARAANRNVPLRLEYHSASGANCWTIVEFPLSGEGAIGPIEKKYGMEFPSVSVSLERPS
jgi:hypothetical protein